MLSLLAIRTEEEFASGHVEDSVNIPVVFFSEAGMTPNTKFVEQLRAAVPDKSTKIIMVSSPSWSSQSIARRSLTHSFVCT